MTREARRSYRVSSMNLDSINFTLGLLADRIDELEGRRGTPTFKNHVDMGSNKIVSLGNAATDTDAINLGGTEDVVAGTASTIASTTLTLGQRLTIIESFVTNATPRRCGDGTNNNEQTITSGGALTLAHGLTVTDAALVSVEIYLKCTDAGGEAGYSQDDILLAQPQMSFVNGATTISRGAAIVVDETNLNIRFGSSANAFTLLNKTTGTYTFITNSKWKAIFVAKI